MLNRIHHIAIICADYKRSKDFYVNILGLEIIKETFREERQSYKLDLSLNGEFIIELFSFPDTPQRLSKPEATGLRHLSFDVDNLNNVVEILKKKNVIAEPIRIDEITNKHFTFIFDPDNLPIELYEK